MEHFDEEAVAAALDPSAVTEALDRAMAELGRGEASTTVRVRAQAPGAMASAMAAAIPSLGVSGGKVYATKAGRFTFHVVLFDLDGRLLCTMDGGALTTVRTPALSAVAIRRLAAPDAAVAAVLGTGIEAGPHVQMLQRELPLGELRVWGRDHDKARAMAAAADAGLGAPIVVPSSADEAVAGADVVVAVTSANEPIFTADAVADGALVCGVGATKPERCELPPQLFDRAGAVVADSVEGSRVECGDLLRAAAAGTFAWDDLVELSSVVAGTVEIARAGTAGPVVFETQGLALQDVVAAAQVWQARS